MNKRKKGNDEDGEDVKYGIVDMNGVSVSSKPVDAGIVDVVMNYELQPREWVKTLGEKELKNLQSILEKYKGRDSQDTTVRALVAELSVAKECE